MPSFRRVTQRVAASLVVLSSVLLFATCDIDKISGTPKGLDPATIKDLFTVGGDTVIALGDVAYMYVSSQRDISHTAQLWTSSNPLVATVDSLSGLVAGVGVGTATITARLIAPELDTGFTQTRGVRIRYGGLKVAKIDSIPGLGVSRAVVVNGTDIKGVVQGGNLTTATLTAHDSGSSASTFVAISGQTVVGRKPGRAYVVALFENLKDSVIVRMRQVAKSITFPTTDYVANAIGVDRFVPVTVRDVADSGYISPSLRWSVSDTSVATINASTGALRAKKVDTTRIFVTADTVTRSQKLVVQQRVEMLEAVGGTNVTDTVTHVITNLPAVIARDTGGTIVAGATVTFRLGTNSQGAVISDSVKTTDANGRATLGGWTLGIRAASQEVVATSERGTAVFKVTALPANPTKLGFSVQPTSVSVSDTIAPTVQVSVQDSLGNENPNGTNNITLALGNNPSGATLTGTTNASAVSGRAKFGNLKLDKTGSGYTLRASTAGLTEAISNSFDAYGAAAKLAFATQPVGTSAGAAMPSIRVMVQDANGILVASAKDTITLAIGSNPASGALSPAAPKAVAAGGVATFNGIAINNAGTGYTLTASSGSLTAATSDAFTVQAVGAPAQLVFSAQPSNAVAGASISPDIKVQILDANGALTASTQQVTLAIGTNPAGGAISGTATVNAVNGEATFSTVSINRAASGYTLVASMAGTSITTTSTAFNITPGAPSKLGFIVNPTHSTQNGTIAPAVKVAVQDQFGNTVSTASPAGVQLAIGVLGGGTTTATLSGGGSTNTSSGVATFSGLSVNTVGTNYVLIATAPGANPTLAQAQSNSFNVVAAGGAIKLGFTAQPPSSATAGSNLTAYTVALQDASGNTVQSAPATTINIAVLSGPGNITGSTNVSTASGVATFSTTALNKTGTYKLIATSGAYRADSSGLITVGPGAAARMNFLTQPKSITAGVPFSPAVQVAIMDANDNVVTSFAPTSVQLNAFFDGGGPGPILFGPGNGTNSVTATTVNGVATFSGITLKTAGTRIRLFPQQVGTLSNFSSTLIDVAAAPASTFGFQQQPTNVAYGAVITPAVAVQVQDSVGNLISGFSGPITLSLTGGVAGATLSGTKTVVAASGVSTFSNLAIDKPGSNYQLSASGSGLATKSSSFFSVTSPATIATGQTGTNSMVGVGSAVYFLNAAFVNKVDIGGGAVTNLIPVSGNARGLRTDGTNLYWAEPSNGRVCKAAISGGTTCSVVASGLPTIIENLQIDGTNLFFESTDVATGTTRAIRRLATTGGASADVITGSSFPVFTVGGGTVYYYSTSTNEIRSVPGAGGSSSLVLSNANVSTVQSKHTMAVVGSNVLFVNSSAEVRSVSSAGGTSTIRSNGSTCNMGEMIVDGSTLYWMDQCSGIYKMTSTFVVTSFGSSTASNAAIAMAVAGSEIAYYENQSASIKKAPK